MKSTWQIQEAKNHLSEVVDLALKKGRQTITRHGRPAVVVLSMDEFKKLRSPANKLGDFFASSPLRGEKLDLKRRADKPRKTDL